MEESSRIEDNPSNHRHKNDLNGIASLLRFSKMLSKVGMIDMSNLPSNEVINDLKKQLDHLSKLPDEFNDHYSNLGWIAYESMNVEIMESAIEYAKKGDIDAGEKILVDFYAPVNLSTQILRLYGSPEFRLRRNLIELAYQEYQMGKYFTSIPLQLMIIDGVVNDIDKGKGFFTESIDLHAWDSIAAHHTGLTKLKGIFTKSRTKTTTEDISLPFRNGILHGRDLNYGNVFVAAKSWALMFAIRDWKTSLNQGKKEAPKIEASKSSKENWGEFVQAVRSYAQSRLKQKEYDEKLQLWKPRDFVLGENIPINGKSADYKPNTPERKVIEVIEYLHEGNYGKLANSIRATLIQLIPVNRLAGNYRNQLGKMEVLGFKIKSLVDLAPAISEISLEIKYIKDGIEQYHDLNFRAIYEDKDGAPLVRGDNKGEWKLIESFIYQLN